MEVGDHRVRAAEGDEPGLEARPEDLDREPERDGTHRHRKDRRQAEREGVRLVRPAASVGPQLIGDPGAQQYGEEAGGGDYGEREGREREHGQRQVGDERAAQSDEGSRDQRADARFEAVEHLVEMLGQVGLDVEDRQDEHQQEAGQHEPEPGQERSALAAPDPTEVDAQLVRLGAWQYLIDGEGLRERLLVDPALLLDALALDHGDLSGRATPSERAELQESNEDRARRIRARSGRPAVVKYRSPAHPSPAVSPNRPPYGTNAADCSVPATRAAASAQPHRPEALLASPRRGTTARCLQATARAASGPAVCRPAAPRSYRVAGARDFPASTQQRDDGDAMARRRTSAATPSLDEEHIGRLETQTDKRKLTTPGVTLRRKHRPYALCGEPRRRSAVEQTCPEQERQHAPVADKRSRDCSADTREHDLRPHGSPAQILHASLWVRVKDACVGRNSHAGWYRHGAPVPDANRESRSAAREPRLTECSFR